MGFVTEAIKHDGGRLAPQWLFGFWVFMDYVKGGGRLRGVDCCSMLLKLKKSSEF